MRYTINDEVYKRISKKLEDGIFTKGKNCKLSTYYFERKTIMDFPISERTPEICVSLMDYGKCDFYDVPEASRTREFFISAFTNHGVFNYIKDNIEQFDREFFKDLLESNEYATNFRENCFAIMPLEYIDEEMCSLAILNTLDWSDYAWFYSTYERKPEALTADLWKLAARLYETDENKILNITPEEYKDVEYYKERCCTNYNCGSEIASWKDKIMDSVPQEILTPEFLVDLLVDSLENIAMFNEKALETKISYSDTSSGEIVTETIWQFVVKLNGDFIRHIELNDERIEYFLKHYDKDSDEYNYAFKDKYKAYKKKKEKPKAYAEQMTRIGNYYRSVAELTLLGVLDGKEPVQAIDDMTEATRNVQQAFLPIRYKERVPAELCKQYDSEEYLELMYNLLGIEIIEERDDLFYRVNMPEEWTVTNKGYLNYVKDKDGEDVITYFYNSLIYDRDAYVRSVNIPDEKKDGIKRLIKQNKQKNENN